MAQASPAAEARQPQVAVVMEQAIPMIEVLERLQSLTDAGASRAEIDAELAGAVDAVLDGPSYTAMFGHYNRSFRPNHLPAKVFGDMILSVSDPDAEITNRRATQMLQLWQEAFTNLDQLRQDVTAVGELLEGGLVADAMVLAGRWLPPVHGATPIEAVHFYLDGGSFPWAHNGNVGVDMLQVPKTADGLAIDIPSLGPSLAHEFHHLLWSSVVGEVDLEARTDEELLALRFVRFLVGEGSAIKFVNNAPGGRAPAIEDRETPDFNAAMQEDWRVYRTEEQALFSNAADLVAGLLSGDLDQSALNDAIGTYWLPGPPRVLGRNYYLGGELLGAVYHHAGWGRVAELLADPSCLLAEYNHAQAALPEFEGAPRFDDEIANRMCAWEQ